MTKKTSKSKLFILLVSLAASIFLWAYVMGVVNYLTESEIRNIPVTFVGQEDMLENHGLIISQGADATVDLTLYGRRSVLTQINRSNIIAEVDLGDIRRTGDNLALAYNIYYPEGVDEADVTIIGRDSYYVYLSIERLETKTIEVRGVLDEDSSVAEGYVVESFEFEPETVEVMGTADQLALLSYAQVTVSRTNISKTITDELDISLISYEGEVLDEEGLNLQTETVVVTLPVAKTKDVNLVVAVNEGGGATSENLATNIEPSKITISGDAEIVDGVSQIVLGTIDLSTITGTETIEYPIVIPNETRNLSGVENATVTVRLVGLDTKTINATQIEFINAPDNLVPTALTQSVTVVIRGSESLIDSITDQNVRLVANLEGYSAVGRYEVAVRVYIDGYENVGAMGSYQVVVALTEPTETDAMAEEENGNSVIVSNGA